MENKTKLLIAVGASVTGNCLPCLNTAVSQAQSAGLDKKEILEAIAIGRVVRKGAIGKMDKLASTLTGKNVASSADECPFGSTEKDVRVGRSRRPMWLHLKARVCLHRICKSLCWRPSVWRYTQGTNRPILRRCMHILPCKIGRQELIE